MKSAPTSFYANLVVVSEALKRHHNLDTDKMLREAGVDLKAAARGDQRVSFEVVDRFWAMAVEATGNPTIGLDVVEDLNPVVYRSLGVALLCSSTLRDFFRRFDRFFAVISTLETTNFEETEEWAVFTDHQLVDYSRATVGCHSDAFAAFLVKLIRMVYKPDYSPLKVQLAWTPPAEYQKRYQDWFGCPIEFGFKDSSVFVNPQDLDVELVGANPDIALQNDQLAMTVLSGMRKLDLPEQVYVRLIDFLPAGDCSREKVARSLAMSESAFQKKLKAAGTSYQELLDDTRMELAKHHLSDPDMSVDEVAYLLGFSDCSNFTRAFKRWLGVSPREYRNSQSA
ncbi:AraC family transcriptional regulator ligand-binding domain-containing protein [Pseudomonadales bacterium]|nr:AraC family transcriptional regulator [Pseudomonadales bacterium]MDC1017664.1 AraC family transcriptional regulator ligand-binding domain-containing protein [Pseudomonadales bacterium]